MATAAIVLAAGQSDRMREFKPMLFVGGRFMIHHIIDALKQAGIRHIIVITGYKSERLKKHISALGVVCIKNPDYAITQMYESIKLGLKALPTGYDSVFITPVDVPLVSADTIRTLSAAGPRLICPRHEGKAGHPVLIPRAIFDALLQYDGAGGLRGVLNSMGVEPVYVDVDDPGILITADNTDGYFAMVHAERELATGGRLGFSLELKLSKSEAFLGMEEAMLLELIQDTGSITTACDCLHISYPSAWKAIKQMEQQTGSKLIESKAGGVEGGGSALTPEGSRLAARYKAFYDDTMLAADAAFEKHFGATPMDKIEKGG